jgi:hypothetical protein
MNRKEVVIISIITFLSVFVWIIFSVYHSNTSNDLTGIKIQEMTPLTPVFDNDIISSLKNRED